MKIEWDTNKNDVNVKKHHISFETAARVFLDENRLDYYDIVHSMNEDRYITIGLVEEVLVVVYTLRKTRIRIISARLATRKERNLYYEENY
ncbi:MAG: BrnT family toxin [Lachnospiraceae bacterium]|nr:BrnT family toxin [Lachnospiraceae bacterium]